MTASIRSDVATGAGFLQVNGVDVLKFDAAGNITINGSVYGVVQTGDFKQCMRQTAPPGWIAGDGSTIGNVGSGATRANADTLALFTLWWTDFSDAQLPILTSAGGASTRGASAAADWAAGKRLTVFDVRDRFVRNGSATNIVGNKQADDFKSHTHATNSGANLVAGGTGTAANLTTGGASFVTTSIANTGGTETRPINIAMLGCFKL